MNGENMVFSLATVLKYFYFVYVKMGIMFALEKKHYFVS